MNELLSAVLSSAIVVLVVSMAYVASSSYLKEEQAKMKASSMLAPLEELKDAIETAESGPEGSAVALDIFLPYQLVKISKNTIGFREPAEARAFLSRRAYIGTAAAPECGEVTIGSVDYVYARAGGFRAMFRKRKLAGQSMLYSLSLNGTEHVLNSESASLGNCYFTSMQSNATFHYENADCVVSYSYPCGNVTFRLMPGASFLEVDAE